MIIPHHPPWPIALILRGTWPRQEPLIQAGGTVLPESEQISKRCEIGQLVGRKGINDSVVLF